MPRDPAFEEQLIILAQEVMDSGDVNKNLSGMKKDTAKDEKAADETDAGK